MLCVPRRNALSPFSQSERRAKALLHNLPILFPCMAAELISWWRTYTNLYLYQLGLFNLIGFVEERVRTPAFSTQTVSNGIWGTATEHGKSFSSVGTGTYIWNACMTAEAELWPVWACARRAQGFLGRSDPIYSPKTLSSSWQLSCANVEP